MKRCLVCFVLELGAAGSSIFPARCDDTTGNHPNHFLLGFRAHALNSHTLSYMEAHNDLLASHTAIFSVKQGRAGQNRAGAGQGRGLK